VLGPPPAPYDDAVVNEARDVEASGVVSTVICFDNGPPVVVIIGDDAANSCVDRPLYRRNVSGLPGGVSTLQLRSDRSPTPDHDLDVDLSILRQPF
jgi:hypothetical protein